MGHYPCPDCCEGGDCCPIEDEYQRAESTSVGAAYTEEEGDWFIEEVTKTWVFYGTFTTSCLITDDVPATLLFADTLPSGDYHSIDFWWGTRELLWDLAGMRFRYFWGWSDDDNYWCVEYEFGDVGVMSYGLCGETDGPDAIRIIERVAGVETVHKEVLNLENRTLLITGSDSMFGQPLPITTTEFSVADKRESVTVCPDGYVQVWFNDFSNPGTYFFVAGPYTFPNTGVTGFKVMESPSGFLLQYVRRCIYSASCEVTCEAETEPCDGVRDTEPDPGPFESCCPDLAGVEVGDAFEFRMDAFDIDSSEECLLDPCAEDIFLVFLALADIFTIECVYVSGTFLVLFGDTGVVVPCSGSDETAKIWVWITKTGEDTCVIRAELFIATCHVYWEKTITDEDACLSVDIPYVGRPGDENCCLNFSGSSARISLP